MKKDRRIVNGVNNFTLCPLERKSEIRMIPVNGKGRMALYVGGQFGSYQLNWKMPLLCTNMVRLVDCLNVLMN